MTGITNPITKSIFKVADGGGGSCDPTPVVVDSVFSDYVTAASVTLTIPPEAEAGDILVLVGFIRAARTAPASGWTEHVDRVETGAGSVSQRLQVLSQTYNGTDVDVTFGTASSLRMGACLTVIRGATELLDFVESDMVYRTVNGLEYDLPEVTNTADARRLCIQCYTSSYTENSTSATTTVNTAGGAEVMNLHNPMGTIGGATNSWARMAAIAFEVDPSDPTVITLPYCAIENRTDPTIPHCYFFVNPATEQPPTPSTGDAAILEVTIPAANIDADLTGFPLVIENKISSPIPSDWFATATGGVMIVKDAAGTELMSEVAYFDEAQNTLRLHVLTDLSSTVDTVITVTAGTAATLTGVVFAGYELVVPISYAADLATIKDFSPNDYSGALHWTETTSSVHPTYFGAGLGVGMRDGCIWTDSINVANNLYGVVDVAYGAMSTSTAMGMSDGDGTMDGLMLRNLSSYGRIASYSDGAGGWQETDNTDNAAWRGVGDRFVASLRYESGVERSVFREGIGKGTDFTVQAPFPVKTRVTIGARDNTTSEEIQGTLFEIRVAESIPSDEWVKAEALNMGKNELYSISVKAEGAAAVPGYLDYRNRFIMDTEGEAPASQNIMDSSGHGQTVTVVGGTNIQADGSVYFDGDGDYFTIPSSDDTTAADAHDMTITLEINCDADGDAIQSLVNKRDGSSAEEYYWYLKDGASKTPEFVTNVGGTFDVVITGANLTAGQWYELRVERRSGVWEMFIDDVSQGTDTESVTPAVNSQALAFGHSAFNSGRQFKGFMRVAKINKEFE